MTTLAEIEAATQQLHEGDVRQLAAWLQEYLDDEKLDRIGNDSRFQMILKTVKH